MPGSKTGKNRQCPYRGHCSNECYGENPCDFALKFDKMQKKINRLIDKNAALKKENEELNRRLKTIVFNRTQTNPIFAKGKIK